MMHRHGLGTVVLYRRSEEDRTKVVNLKLEFDGRSGTHLVS